jgi:large subunit ribosomal protein L21e
MKRTGTARRKTRHLFQKSKKQRGKISIKNFLQSFKIGEKVLLKAEPAIQKGMYFRRFHGKTGEVLGKQGSNYKIKLKIKNKIKQILAHPVHLRKCQKLK